MATRSLHAFMRLEIAAHQLERALKLYFSGRDLVSAVTLASCAEAIFDHLLEGTDSAAEPSDSGHEQRAAFAERWRSYFDRKPLIDVATSIRTGLRDLGDEDMRFDPDDVARDVLERAILKHLDLTGSLSPRMRRFRALPARSGPGWLRPTYRRTRAITPSRPSCRGGR